MRVAVDLAGLEWSSLSTGGEASPPNSPQTARLNRLDGCRGALGTFLWCLDAVSLMRLMLER